MANSSAAGRILVRAPNWIGDQVLAYPFFHYLRQAHPKAHIAVAAGSWVSTIQFKNLVDQVFILPRPTDSTLAAKWKSLEAGAKPIRASGPWHSGFSLPNSFSAAWLLFRSGVRTRYGYALDGRSLLLTHALPWKKAAALHRAEAYVNLLPVAHRPGKRDPSISQFWGVPPENELDPPIPGVEEVFDAARAWPDAEPLTPPQEEFWVLAPGSTAESRRWPIDRFAALARDLGRTTGLRGIIIGGTAEVAAAEQLMDQAGKYLLNWTGKGTVASYWKVFQQARFTVCNDSGLAHISTLCGCPTHIIWGAGQPKKTEPLGPGRVQISFNPVDCWPCERNLCLLPAEKKLQCLKGIESDVVWKEIQSGIGFL